MRVENTWDKKSHDMLPYLKLATIKEFFADIEEEILPDGNILTVFIEAKTIFEKLGLKKFQD